MAYGGGGRDQADGSLQVFQPDEGEPQPSPCPALASLLMTTAVQGFGFIIDDGDEMRDIEGEYMRSPTRGPIQSS